MADPASEKKTMRTCPKCRTPARPHYKYCEVCGTRIPDLLTCSRCGTQFITPITYCDLCGARVVGEEPGPYLDEDPEPAAGTTAEEDGDVLAVEDTEETSGDYGEDDEPYDNEPPGYAEEDGVEEQYEEEPQGRAGNGMEEPDTDELLQTFGEEFDDSETVESGRRPRAKQKEQPAAAKPASPGKRFSDTITSALFFPDSGEGAPATKQKPAGGHMRLIGAAVLLILAAAVIGFIILPLLGDSGGPGTHSSVTVTDITSLPQSTSLPVITPAPAVPLTLASGRFVPQPTQTLPSGQYTYVFRVEKSPFTSKILITYAGSAGHGSISSADVTVTRSDGSVATGVILPLKGITEIVLEGSKETDHVVIIAAMSSGESYRVYDKLVE